MNPSDTPAAEETPMAPLAAASRAPAPPSVNGASLAPEPSGAYRGIDPGYALAIDELRRSSEATHASFDRAIEQQAAATERLTAGMDRLSDRIDKTSARVFYLACAILVVLAASSSAQVYFNITQGGVTVATSGAAAP